MKPATGNKRDRVLLTGFSPFAGETVNPSWQAVRALDRKVIEGHRIVAIELPTEFAGSLQALSKALRETAPRVAIAVGLAGGRRGISLERVAINVVDARIPDNSGAQPIDEAVVRRGPAAYFSTLPIKSALASLRNAGIEAQVSQTAGTYVCNHVFYALMHAARRKRMRAGFVHVPFLPEQARRHRAADMPLEGMIHALEIIVRTALVSRPDARIGAGAEG